MTFGFRSPIGFSNSWRDRSDSLRSYVKYVLHAFTAVYSMFSVTRMSWCYSERFNSSQTELNIIM